MKEIKEYIGNPTQDFWHIWRSGPRKKKQLKDRGWVVKPDGDNWVASIPVENFDKYHSEEIGELLNIDGIEKVEEIEEILPSTIDGSKGAPYDSSDLNKFQPNGCLGLIVEGKKIDKYSIDSCLDVVEIIDRYLPHKRDDNTKKEERIWKNARQLASMIKEKYPEEKKFQIGENKKYKFIIIVQNYNALNLDF